MNASPPVKKLGDRLLDAGLITPHQLELALREQRRSGQLIGETMQELGFVKEQDIASLLAQDAHTEAIDILYAEIDRELADLIPQELAREFTLIPFERKGDTLVVVMSDPFDVIAIDRIEQLTRLRLRVLTAPAPDILEKINTLYLEESDSLEKTIDELMKIGVEEGGLDDTAPMIRFVEEILRKAIKMNASDIHFEPDEKILRIRMRVDGILQPFLLIPRDLQDAVTARLKVLGNLDLAESRLPQDGRMSQQIGRKKVNFRVSSLPTAFGESIVLRILDSGAVVHELASLGMVPSKEDSILKAVGRPHGILLVTGPTGSGKTTTLYTALNSVNSAERSVFTLEDPIEYQLSGIRQTQIVEKIGLSFSAGLRTLLRQDPDVILVGETRDLETAQLMVRAALTGHLVLSSLHTNDAIGAIPRLIDLGVEPFLLPATLHLVIAQRLVRRLCQSCRKPVEDPSNLLAEFGVSPDGRDVSQICRSGSCDECGSAGYRGRMGLYEFLEIDEDFRPFLPAGDVEMIRKLAGEKGMESILEEGVSRALQGETTLEEVFRVSM